MPDLILAIVASVLLVLFIREYLLRRFLSRRQEQLLLAEQQKGQGIIADAIQKAQTITTQAELVSVKNTTENQNQVLKHQSEYDQRLTQFLNYLEQMLRTDLSQSQQRLSKTEQLFQSYVGELSSRLTQNDRKAEELLQKNADRSAEVLQHDFSSFLTELENKSLTSVNEELKNSRERVRLIEEKRIREVEENLVAILEKTAEVVFSKRLSLAEHAELVAESFAKAKEENFLA